MVYDIQARVIYVVTHGSQTSAGSRLPHRVSPSPSRPPGCWGCVYGHADYCRIFRLQRNTHSSRRTCVLKARHLRRQPDTEQKRRWCWPNKSPPRATGSMGIRCTHFTYEYELNPKKRKKKQNINQFINININQPASSVLIIIIMKKLQLISV